MIGFGQQTYVPDDNFEAWIETTYPAASTGAIDDSVLTTGIELNSNSSWVNIHNNMGPIFGK